MAKSKPSKNELLRQIGRLEPYPAVFWPAPHGIEVIFPNLAGLSAYGRNLPAARRAAKEMLTAELALRLARGEQLPTPSDPQRLIPDEDEPAGTRLELVEADQPLLMRRLGLTKRPRGEVLGRLAGR